MFSQGSSSAISGFCSSYIEIEKAAADKFNSVKGNLRSEEGSAFKTTIHNVTKNISGATDCYIENVLGAKYVALFGEFSSLNEAEEMFNKILNYNIKNCLSDRNYVANNPRDAIMQSVEIIKKYENGFDLYGNTLIVFKTKTGNYQVKLTIAPPSESNRLYKINGSLFGSSDKNFDDNLQKIAESSRNEFRSILGAKSEQTGFGGTITRYEINATLPGITGLSYQTGGLSFGANELKGIKYEGTSKEEAMKHYNELAEKVQKALSFGYVYMKSESDELKRHVFAKESEIKSEKTEVITVEYYYSSFDKMYSVKIKFGYKSFGSIF